MIEFMGVANIFYAYPNFRIILVAKGVLIVEVGL